MYLLSPLLSWLFRKIRLDIPKHNWLFFTLPIGILSHLLAGKITPMTSDFMDIHSHYLIKVLIIGSFILGLRGIKIVKE
ncbi:hypothetical protein KJ657_03345 [Patescibacteria group bacterium]|nr:hypothetical protein [Patescibacteria group bacterium]MBU1016099.1 hypothetical protein [Patescibacteria group bacterium]MBU1684842.1 hypothetical protein [Patescibacteria group bacterium]MBU1938558.1 hypothetical protein [Patescibacteria group bacterium]